MVFRFLIRFLLSDKVVDKLAESYPIRKAARWAVYVIHRAKAIKGDNSTILKDNDWKIFKQVAIRLFHLFQRYQPIKPIKPANEGKSFQNKASNEFQSSQFPENNNKSELGKKRADTVSSDGEAKERMRQYIEELKRRTQK